VSRSRNSADAHRALAQLEEDGGNLEDAVWHLWELRRVDRASQDQVSADLARLYRALLRVEEARSASRPASDGP
jgi:hypothetical protein